MKSLEALFVEKLDLMNPKQKDKFFSERDKLKKQSGELPSMEAQLNLAEKILGGKATAVESFTESHQIRRNNGRDLFQESATTEITEAQERQVEAWMKMGNSRLESEALAGVHDRALKLATFQGKTATQFFESLRESASGDQGDLKKRQDAAYRLMNR